MTRTCSWSCAVASRAVALGAVDADGAADRLEQVIERDARLGEVVGRPRLHHVDGELLVALAGHHDDGRGDAGGADAREHGEAVVVGQVVVEQDDSRSGSVFSSSIADAPSAASATSVVISADFSARAHRHAVDVVVVDDQDVECVGHRNSTKRCRRGNVSDIVVIVCHRLCTFLRKFVHRPILVQRRHDLDERLERHGLEDVAGDVELVGLDLVAFLVAGGEDDDGEWA